MNIKEFYKMLFKNHDLDEETSSYCQFFLSEFQYNDKIIMKSCRQSLKTTLILTDALYYALNDPDGCVVILVNNQESARRYKNQIETILPSEFIRTKSREYVELSNGCQVVVTNCSNDMYAVKGRGVSYLSIDDMDFCDNIKTEEFWKAVYPCISRRKHQRILICSSINPLNQGNSLFHKLFDGSPSNGFESYEIKWNNLPNRDRKWESEMIKVLGCEVFDSEYNNML